jgi:hypothetical protein
MTWRIEIGLRIRIGRERGKPNANAERQPSSSDIFESAGAAIELSGQPVAPTAVPIGFHPEPLDAGRSATSTSPQP